MNIQTRIANIEKQVNAVISDGLSYIISSKIDSDGTELFEVDRGSGMEWINRTEFDAFVEVNYPKHTNKPILILDLPRIIGLPER